jgi:hypothetical protein
MHYEDEDFGFSFQLPDGWRKDEINQTLTFFGPGDYVGNPTDGNLDTLLSSVSAIS